MGFNKTLEKRISIKKLDKEEALTAEEKAKYEKYFRHFDKDKSGDIDVVELGKVLKHCGYNFDKIPGAVEWIVSLVDLDGSKTFSEGEFIYFIGNVVKMKKLFKKADADKSATVDKQELVTILKKANYLFDEKQVATLMPLVDKDSSGELNMEEWLILTIFLRFCKIQFLLADVDGSEELTFKEVLGHLPALGLAPDPELATKLMQKLDTDNSGALSYEEFTLLAAMLKLQ